ncbi:diaminopimelate epimerase [Dokdonia pacifica]|uniref:Diaminopimelate epimerase n=1 Tax=Dokdonia pacifica TaxID=1627892 RepID=A0A239CHC8_9FLAO|nr:diaminopimelate epimerase [Dokdonia pacifica]GGG38212.1 diaminopimelate epimerase [Dokdonia pacifica]SNS19597.1 diaminopimelate epimerase [Dokdonia pacifica]
MTIPFKKYQGTGNDFVIIDNRHLFFPKDDTKLISKLCDRKFGIGADGLILLENHDLVDFTMVYYNADGKQSSMCGNGGRCIVAFAKALEIIQSSTTFMAIDGLHEASIANDGIVHLKMQDVTGIKATPSYSFLDTGSPHHIQFAENLSELDVKKEGACIRYSDTYGSAGSNINFVSQKEPNVFAVRTYERGVEDETLSCGTGVTAVALAMHHQGKTNEKRVRLDVEGGELEVSFEKDGDGYANIFLIGPATYVFEGEITW